MRNNGIPFHSAIEIGNVNLLPIAMAEMGQEREAVNKRKVSFQCRYPTSRELPSDLITQRKDESENLGSYVAAVQRACEPCRGHNVPFAICATG